MISGTTRTEAVSVLILKFNNEKILIEEDNRFANRMTSASYTIQSTFLDSIIAHPDSPTVGAGSLIAIENKKGLLTKVTLTPYGASVNHMQCLPR